jgi:hypothetical protein
MSKDMLSMARTEEKKLQDRLKPLQVKCSAIEKSLTRVQAVIKLLDPSQDIGNGSTLAKNDKVILPEVEEEVEVPSVADRVRIFLKGSINGKTLQQLRDLAEAGYPQSMDIFNRGVYNALSYLQSNAEIEKFGSGSIAVYKPTSKLKEYVVPKKET